MYRLSSHAALFWSRPLGRRFLARSNSSWPNLVNPPGDPRAYACSAIESLRLSVFIRGLKTVLSCLMPSPWVIEVFQSHRDSRQCLAEQRLQMCKWKQASSESRSGAPQRA